MVVLGDFEFLMSEEPLYEQPKPDSLHPEPVNPKLETEILHAKRRTETANSES